MNNSQIFENLQNIYGPNALSNNDEILKDYSKDLSFLQEMTPLCVVWPSKTKEIEETVKLANNLNFSLIPISSKAGPRQNGDTIPRKDNSVILDLSKMDKILEIDEKNRVIMVEPGVTYGDLIPKLKKKGLRLSLPLFPRVSKSVLSCVLEREPTTIPRYMWDSSDPLLCTEVIFGTGDLFRTGTAAGPGTIKQQKKMGQAQINPMGPTQFSPYRVIQGAQGSMGVVAWCTIKVELLPTKQKVFHIQSDKIEDLLNFQQKLLKYRLCDELLVLNDLNLASLIRQDSEKILDLANELNEWNLIYVISGRGELANDRISYLEGDINDIIEEESLISLKSSKTLISADILKFLTEASNNPWRMRLRGGSQNIFFISNYNNIPKFISLVKKQVSNDLGIYIQPINQGTSYHCEFNLFYNPEEYARSQDFKERYMGISKELMDNGAFFNRPYGLWADEVFNRHADSTQMALKKVKKIFDPKNVLNPGVLCFDK
ncbi:MAG: FAD-binding oxidoreductase [Promethearchaeota archaeon]